MIRNIHPYACMHVCVCTSIHIPFIYNYMHTYSLEAYFIYFIVITLISFSKKFKQEWNFQKISWENLFISLAGLFSFVFVQLKKMLKILAELACMQYN